MQFSAVLLALAASASAAVLPRDGMGQWHVTMQVGPAPKYVYLHAEFTSDEYPGDNKLRSTCVEAPEAELPVVHRCDRAAFDFKWDGKCKFSLSHHAKAELTFNSAQRSANSSQRCYPLRFRPLRRQHQVRQCHPRREGRPLNQMITSFLCDWQDVIRVYIIMYIVRRYKYKFYVHHSSPTHLPYFPLTPCTKNVNGLLQYVPPCVREAQTLNSLSHAFVGLGLTF